MKTYEVIYTAYGFGGQGDPIEYTKTVEFSFLSQALFFIEEKHLTEYKLFSVERIQIH